jgi:PAS domain S-box-containing protein
MVGYTRDEILFRSRRDLTAPEYREQDDRIMQELSDTGVINPIEKEYIRKDGSRIPVLMGAAALTGSKNMER